MLRVITRMVAFFVIPGYVLMLVTGLWMVNLSWPLTTKWIQAALVLWSTGMVIFGIFLAVVHNQLRLFDTKGPESTPYRRASLLGRVLGGGVGFVVVTILYLMVFKPGN